MLTQYSFSKYFFPTDNFLSCIYFGCQCAGIETKCARLRTESRGYIYSQEVQFSSVIRHGQAICTTRQCTFFLWHRCIFGAGHGKSTFVDPYLMISNGDRSRELTIIVIIISQSIEHFWLVAARRQDQYSAAAAHTRAPACRKSRLFMALGEFYGLRSLRSGLCKRQSR